MRGEGGELALGGLCCSGEGRGPNGRMALLLNPGVKSAGVGGQEIRAAGLKHIRARGRLGARLAEVRMWAEVLLFGYKVRVYLRRVLGLSENKPRLYLRGIWSQKNDGPRRIRIVLGIAYWSQGCIPSRGGTSHKFQHFIWRKATRRPQ